MNGKSQLEENAQFSTFFFAEQILIFIHKVCRNEFDRPAYLRKKETVTRMDYRLD